jgi:hypothetical protein
MSILVGVDESAKMGQITKKTQISRRPKYIKLIFLYFIKEELKRDFLSSFQLISILYALLRDHAVPVVLVQICALRKE